MSRFKFTNLNNEILHIVSESYGEVVIEDEGFWSPMTDDEYNEFTKINDEKMDLNPPPPIEPLTPQQKLESLGLTIDDLKQLLNI